MTSSASRLTAASSSGPPLRDTTTPQPTASASAKTAPRGPGLNRMARLLPRTPRSSGRTTAPKSIPSRREPAVDRKNAPRCRHGSHLLELRREVPQHRRRLHDPQPADLLAPPEHLRRRLDHVVDVALRVHPPRDR